MEILDNETDEEDEESSLRKQRGIKSKMAVMLSTSGDEQEYKYE